MNTYQSAYKGKYVPVNPHLWVDPGRVVYKSSVEYSYMRYFDVHPATLKIAYEKVVVPYLDPATQKPRRYIVDLLVQMKTPKGTQTFLIELKSSGETKMPKAQKIITEAYKQKVYTYAVNSAKWTAAKLFCEKRGWVFQVFSEKDMKKTR